MRGKGARHFGERRADAPPPAPEASRCTHQLHIFRRVSLERVLQLRVEALQVVQVHLQVQLGLAPPLQQLVAVERRMRIASTSCDWVRVRIAARAKRRRSERAPVREDAMLIPEVANELAKLVARSLARGDLGRCVRAGRSLHAEGDGFGVPAGHDCKAARAMENEGRDQPHNYS